MSSHPFGRSVSLNRRRLLAAAAITLFGARPAAARQDATPAASGEWTFVDDAGVTISRPTRPERVVAYLPLAAALWDYGLRPVGYYGTSRKPDGAPEVYAGISISMPSSRSANSMVKWISRRWSPCGPI